MYIPPWALDPSWGSGVGEGGGEGDGVLASGILIPNLLTNYPTKLHEIKTMCTNISA